MFWSFPYCPSETDWSINWTALEAEFDWLRLFGMQLISVANYAVC
ncbi:hypothetical protein [Fischerella thermalis]|nr:hypothetical protein [Fischerella thermalis]